MMNLKSPQWLEDIADACAFIFELTRGADEGSLTRDRLLRQVVERNFEIIGEALRRLEHADPETASRISDYRQIIGLRNRLVHGYDAVDYHRVWNIMQQELPVLHREVDRLLQEAEDAWQGGHWDGESRRS